MGIGLGDPVDRPCRLTVTDEEKLHG
jgi:hypothetical protein